MENKSNNFNHYLILLLFTLSITFFLFYIDEGYYNFKWMLKIGNWVALFIYIIPIFFIQLGIYKLFKKNTSAYFKIALSLFSGTTIGLVLVFYLLS